jgi:SAM-dependent methyltransferase
VVERLIQRLPVGRRAAAQHRFRRARLNRYLKRRLGARFEPVAEGPVPPRELLAQTSVLHEAQLSAAGERDVYFAGGYLGTSMFLETVEEHGFDLASARAVLDFGCGAAKTIRLLRGIQGLRLVGSDVNPAQIAWAREHVPGVDFHVNGLEPPLEFAEDGVFDLVTAASVFTHVPLHLQTPWLEEIERVLVPGGYFLCTVAGRYHIEAQLSPGLRDELVRVGHVTLGADDPGVSYATTAARSWDVFQTRQEVLDAFGGVFEVLHYSELDEGQDRLVLRKRRR